MSNRSQSSCFHLQNPGVKLPRGNWSLGYGIKNQMASGLWHKIIVWLPGGGTAASRSPANSVCYQGFGRLPFQHVENVISIFCFKKIMNGAWLGGSGGWKVVPYTKRVTGSIPSQDTYLGWGLIQSECVWETTNWCFSLSPSLSLFLSPFLYL